MDAVKNFAKVTVSGGYDDTAASINVITGDGARLPTVPFNAVWWNNTDYPDPADDPNREIVRVTARSIDALTVTRGQEGTFAITHNTEGKTYRMVAGPTAKTITDLWGTGAAKLDLTDPVSQIGDIGGAGNNTKIILDDGAKTIDISASGGTVSVGDENTAVFVDAGTGIVKHFGQLGTDQSADATVGVGAIVKKLPIYNNSGTLLGYVPIYSSIT